jgi:hemerythrin-like domain-containing protein
MEPIGPLMHEHRLIEEMVALINDEIEVIKKTEAPDLAFLNAAADFMSTYADRCHHGKEEDILFRELSKKELTQEHAAMLNDLIEDHRYGRQMVTDLKEHMARQRQGEDASAEIVAVLAKLADFYPEHIRKEDKEFFFPVLEYFSEEEREAMLKEYDEFDKSLVHEHYQDVVDGLKQRVGAR